MTRETTYRLGDERDRLDRRLDEVVERLAAADSGTPVATSLRQVGNELDSRGAGVAHLIAEYGADATVTVRGLLAGEFARVEDRVATMAAQSDGPGDLPGSRANVLAAAGLVEAPFWTPDDDYHDQPPAEQLDVRIGVVADQPVGVRKWLEGRTNHLTTRGTEGNWQSMDDRLADQTDATGETT